MLRTQVADPSYRWRRVSLIGLLASAACATALSTSPTTSSGRPAAVSPDLKLVSHYRAANRYGGAPPARQLGEFRRAMDRRLSATGDARLDRVASDLVELFVQTDELPYRAVEFFLHHHGVAEPAPALVSIKTRASTTVALADAVQGHLDDTLRSRKSKRYGAAYQAIPGGYAVVVLLQEHALKLDPVARRMTKTGVIEVRGMLPRGFSQPLLFRTGPRGSVERPVVVVDKDGFHGAFECRLGRNQVEVTADGPLGVTVLANFPVFCGISPPTTLDLQLSRKDHDRSDEELARQIFELANEERQRAGLVPLVWSAEAAEVSLRHSEDMRTSDFVGHVSPNTGAPADRVSEAGIKVSLMLENVARAPSADDAHLGLMNSPGHRANILSSEATELGVGVRRRENGELLVTQLFFRRPAPMNLDKVRVRLNQEITGARRRARRTAWRIDAWLEEIAGRQARALASGGGGVRQPRPEGGAGRYRQLITEVQVLGSVNDFAVQSVERQGAAGYGIGLAQGDHHRLGANVLYVVLLIGVPRDSG